MARSTSTHPENEKAFGEPIKYNPDFRGPLKGRSCTDIICLLLFVVFMICWIAIGIYAMTNGDPNSLLIPKDSKGRRCGHDSEVHDKPYLFFVDITKCVGPNVLITGCETEQICVKKCPEENFFWENNLSKVICTDEVKTLKTNPKKDIIKDAVDKGLCAKWYVKSEPVTHRCIPTIDNDTRTFIIENIKKTVDDIVKSQKNIEFLAKTEQVIVMISEDIVNSWWKILIGLAASLVVCFLYIYLMRWVASYVIWFSLFGILAILSYGIYASYEKYNELKKQEANSADKTDSTWLEDKSIWLFFLIVLAILLIIALLVLIFLRKRIIVAIALIKEGSKAVGACISSLFFPIFPWIFQILVLAYAVATGLYLSSIGDKFFNVHNMTDTCPCHDHYKDGDLCIPNIFVNDCFKTTEDSCNAKCSLTPMKNPIYVRILHAINVVGGFWGVFFVSAFGEMVLAATFATWYWTFKKSKVPFFTVTHSVYRTLRYHVGTLAFGSLIITICRLIRIAIEYVDHKLKKYDNQIVKAILCCCKCFFWCLENFLKFINRNAYIMCAIHGKNFCTSAKDAFSLLMRNILRVFVLDKVTDLLFFLGKILVTACVATVAYTAFTNKKFVNTEDLHYALVPVILITIGAFFISNLFFGVYAMAVDTLFLCFLEDSERNDGSSEKPYYMSKELMKILGKKNKKNK